MVDIAKCKGERNGKICKVREKCWRFTASADKYWQAYLHPVQLGKKCEYYWERNNGKKA